MTTDWQTVRAKLSTPTAARSLARVALDVLDATPLDQVAPAPRLAGLLQALTHGLLTSDALSPELTRTVDRAVQALRAQPTTQLKQTVPQAVRHALRDVVARPLSPDRKAVLTVMDREPVRELVRALLLDAVMDFGRKASAPVAGVAKGLGSLAKLAGGTLRSQGPLGGLVGAVSDEVERQLERRAQEFVDAALGGIFGKVADLLSDPKRAAEAAELRLAFFDGALELTHAQLARELMNADVAGAAQTLKRALEAAASGPEGQALFTRAAEALVAELAGKTVGAAIDTWGLRRAVNEHVEPWLSERLEALLASDPFARWLEATLTTGG